MASQKPGLRQETRIVPFLWLGPQKKKQRMKRTIYLNGCLYLRNIPELPAKKMFGWKLKKDQTEPETAE